jgi:hypothetical protein
LRLSNRHGKYRDEDNPAVMDHIWHEGTLEVVSGKDGSVLLRFDGNSVLRDP